MVDDQRIVLPEQGQEMRKHTPWPQPPAPAPQPRTPETHPLSWLEHLGLVTPQKPRPVVPTLREAEAAGNTSDVDVDQQLPIELAGGDILPNVHLPDVAFLEARPDCSVGDEWTSPRVAEEAMVVAFGLGSGSCLVCVLCSNLSISGIDYYTRHEVFGSLKVYFIYGFWIGFILLGLFYSWYYGTSCMQRLCNSWRVRNLLVMVLRLNKLAESIVSLNTRLLWPGANVLSFLQCILHSLCVVDNSTEDPFPLPRIFMPKDVHPRQLAT